MHAEKTQDAKIIFLDPFAGAGTTPATAKRLGRQGIAIEVLQRIELKAITVNAVAPQSHRFDSGHLRGLIQAAVDNVPVVDVRDASYLQQPA